MNEELFEKLFPWPADRPLRRARFGNPPTRGELRREDLNAYQSLPEDWFMKWDDPDLGLEVEVRLDRDSGEVWAFAASTHPGSLGKKASVRLMGEKEGQIRGVTVLLDEKEGRKGRARLASLEDLYELGEKVYLVVFLLE